MEPSPEPADPGAPEVIHLCDDLVPDVGPAHIRVDAPAWAKPNDCFVNVDRQQQERGGSIEYGWALWESFPGVLLEAEFHAVWMGGPGLRLDVTPKPFEQILFLHDPGLRYEGHQVDNVRRPLQDDALIRQFICDNEQLFEMMNRGQLAHFHGEMEPTPEMLKIHRRLGRRGKQLLSRYYGGEAA